jgi:hypothetical protein
MGQCHEFFSSNFRYIFVFIRRIFVHMFLIDIPFKGYQRRTNRSCIVHAVSYLAYRYFDATCTLNISKNSKLEFICKRALAA